ncbi:CcdC protein domain-containing protein [Paenibacillus sp. D51F]
MTQQQWDWIGYGVWALIIWMTFKQFRQTRREMKGSGIKLLLGDWLLLAPLPWIAVCMGSRATLVQAAWTLGLGIMLSLPYILTTRFEARSGGRIFFKFNLLFYVFLLGLPYVRYLIRDKVFHTYPILTPEHRPDIELMLAMYIAAMVICTFLWRVWMYASYRRLVREDRIEIPMRTPNIDRQSV